MTDKRTRHVVLKWFSGVENPPQKTFVNNEFRFLKADGTFLDYKMDHSFMVCSLCYKRRTVSFDPQSSYSNSSITKQQLS